jgi:hypothetical protein
MEKELALSEYRSLAYTLRPIKPLGTCCGNVLLETIHVEPLAGRSKAVVKQTCVVQCPECKTNISTRFFSCPTVVISIFALALRWGFLLPN